MTKQEALNWFRLRKGMCLSDRTQEAEDIAIECIAAVMAQEHPTTFHVIDRKTGREADTYRIAMNEKWAAGLCYCDMEGFAVCEDGSLMLLDECGNFVYCDRERFEVVWDD